MAESSGFSLSDTFKKANHYRHMLMDFTMITMAIGTVVATGGMFGLFDPIGLFLNMHIPSPSDIGSIGSFVTDAFSNAANGTFITDAALTAPHAVHGVGAASHAVTAGAVHTAHATGAVAASSTAAAHGGLHGAHSLFANQWDWFGSLAGNVQDQFITDAASFGMPLEQYIEDWCPPHLLAP